MMWVVQSTQHKKWRYKLFQEYWVLIMLTFSTANICRYVRPACLTYALDKRRTLSVAVCLRSVSVLSVFKVFRYILLCEFFTKTLQKNIMLKMAVFWYVAPCTLLELYLSQSELEVCSLYWSAVMCLRWARTAFTVVYYVCTKLNNGSDKNYSSLLWLTLNQENGENFIKWRLFVHFTSL